MRDQLYIKNIKLSELFDMIDHDKDRALSFLEFEGMMIWLGMPLNADQIQSLAMVLDRNQNGLVEYQELMLKFKDTFIIEKQRSVSKMHFPKIIIGQDDVYGKMSKTFYM